METDVQTLIARLLALRHIPRNDKLARRALADEAFRLELDLRLAACGLRLLDNPFAGHIGVALAQEQIEPVFGRDKTWQNNNMGLTRDCLALLTVIWALIILPKRERQIARRTLEEQSQSDMFGAERPLPQGSEVSSGLSEAMLIADFGEQLGGKARMISFNLPILSRLGFIERRNKMIYEGPLLDLALDYNVLAPRIMEGALAELLANRPLSAAPSPSPDAANDPTPDANEFESQESY